MATEGKLRVPCLFYVLYLVTNCKFNKDGIHWFRSTWASVMTSTPAFYKSQ